MIEIPNNLDWNREIESERECVCMWLTMKAWRCFHFGCIYREIEYELNAKSNLINNIRFNQIHWMTHTWHSDHTNGVCFGLILLYAFGHTIMRWRASRNFPEWLKMLLLYFKNVHVVKITIRWSLKMDSCFALKLTQYFPLNALLTVRTRYAETSPSQSSQYTFVLFYALAAKLWG